MKSIKRYSALLLFAATLFSLVRFSFMGPSLKPEAEPTTEFNAPHSLFSSSEHFPQQSNSKASSFRGTNIDGKLEVDLQGYLIITKGLKDMFDYFLSSFGERSMAAILVSLKRHIHQQLEEPARSQALEIMHSYFSYKNALLELEVPLNESNANILKSNNLNMFKERLLAINRLRQDYFTQEQNQAFFSHTEQYDQVTLRRMEINHNELLSPDEKQALLQEADQQLPEDVLRIKDSSSKHLSLKAKQMTMKDATTEEIYNMRAQEVGAEAATRLARLDDQRTQWQQRSQDYQNEKELILQSGLSPQDQDQSLQQLLEVRFNTNEIRRLRALESISRNP